MPFENLLEKIDEYGEFVKYRPITPIQIFQYKLDNCECEIQISKTLSKETIAPILIDLYAIYRTGTEDVFLQEENTH